MLSLDGQIAERDDSPGSEHNYSAQNQPAVFEREIDKRAKHLLVPRGFKQQCIVDDLLTGLNARQDFLPVATEHLPGVDLGPPELVVARRHKDPIAIVQVQHRIRRNRRMRLRFTAGESRRGEHSQLQEAWIRNLDTHLGGSQ